MLTSIGDAGIVGAVAYGLICPGESMVRTDPGHHQSKSIVRSCGSPIIVCIAFSHRHEYHEQTRSQSIDWDCIMTRLQYMGSGETEGGRKFAVYS
jgi:hypothetical protein